MGYPNEKIKFFNSYSWFDLCYLHNRKYFKFINSDLSANINKQHWWNLRNLIAVVLQVFSTVFTLTVTVQWHNKLTTHYKTCLTGSNKTHVWLGVDSTQNKKPFKFHCCMLHHFYTGFNIYIFIEKSILYISVERHDYQKNQFI